jgi:ribonucleoside-diphosphate reductase alpha chain
VHEVAKKTIEGIYDGVKTTELDNLAAETAASLTTIHPDYAILASRIAVSNLHKNTIKSFSETMRSLHHHALIANEILHIIEQYADLLDSTIIYDRDYGFDYFGFKTLEKSYLLRIDNQIANVLNICICG